MAVETEREKLEPDLERIARASLKELGDIRIDDVLSFIDRGIENMPSYMDLYRRWESQQWAVGDLDFSLDRQDWLDASEMDRKATLWSHRLFFNGEERVTSTLAPFVWAAPSPEVEIFLSTQMVDEARHTVFFERWWREVVGTDARDLTQLLKEIRPDTNEGYNELFYDRLPATSQRLASNPRVVDAFVQGITLYHIVIEATLWSHRLFFNGEERVTSTLAPFVWAAPSPEVEIFLSTQMVDEARHTVFFERWWREVVGTDAKDLTQLLKEIRPDANEGYNELFYERLPSAAQRLATNPKDFDAFVEGITLYHLLIEATLALTGQRFELEAMREEGNTDRGFYRGFTAVARDESRHVNFGIKVLRDAVREDAARYAPIIQKTLVECLPLVSNTLDPPDPRYITDYGHTESEILQFAFDSLNKRLRAIGINLAA